MALKACPGRAALPGLWEHLHGQVGGKEECAGEEVVLAQTPRQAGASLALYGDFHITALPAFSCYDSSEVGEAAYTQKTMQLANGVLDIHQILSQYLPMYPDPHQGLESKAGRN